AVVDVYLASFPHSGDTAVLEAMGAGKPVVVLKYPADSPYGSASELVGVPELIAKRESEYPEIAIRMIRDREARERASAAVLTRFQREFHPSMLGPRFMKLVEGIIKNH